ncbi:NHLP bacteriocin export ABC transporter permease/ATPase subunit [Desulforhopalus sp. 52FAK]
MKESNKNWQDRLLRRRKTKNDILHNSLARMESTILGTTFATIDPFADSVTNACRLVLKKLGAPGAFKDSTDDSGQKTTNIDRVRLIAENSNYRVRKVTLSSDHWWTENNVPMVAFLEDGGAPVALIPTDRQSCVAIEPETGTSVTVTKKYAQLLHLQAWTFYKPLPARPLSAMDLIKFCLYGGKADIFYMLTWGLVIALLALVTPVATNKVFDSAIPNADKGLLLQMLIILLACGLTSWAISYVQSVSIVRFLTRADYQTQAAVWDRLLSLPVSFFSKFNAGDLANRAMSISKIKETLSVTVITGMISGLFSFCSVLVMFYYSWQLTLVVLFVVSSFSIVTLLVAVMIYRHQVVLAQKEGELSGLTLQFFTGIAKLRMTCSEKEAFLQWVTLFQQKKNAYRKSGIWQMSMQALGKNLKLFNMIAIFWVFFMFLQGNSSSSNLSTGSFMAFYSAYGSFQAAVMALLQGIFTTLHCIPQFKRIQPILLTEPEISEDKPVAETLEGNIKIHNVSYRYTPEGPLVLHNISMHIESGQFIALVGNSGSGKSTMLRLLLGFDFPAEGSIFYDTNDLTKVDLRGLRRQLGVVLQNGKILQGTIFENIVGGSALLSHDDAWDAARLAGCYDDIKAMPMGMHTVVTAGGGTLSGGQRQRIMIARAIVHKPKIIFFDEATSALDNKTQKIVSESLEQLDATRIIIAHRLSTIENADKILFLENGHIAEEGNYAQLMELKGYFYKLAKRQIT